MRICSLKWNVLTSGSPLALFIYCLSRNFFFQIYIPRGEREFALLNGMSLRQGLLWPCLFTVYHEIFFFKFTYPVGGGGREFAPLNIISLR
jgi:hypothetical protein